MVNTSGHNEYFGLERLHGIFSVWSRTCISILCDHDPQTTCCIMNHLAYKTSVYSNSDPLLKTSIIKYFKWLCEIYIGTILFSSSVRRMWFTFTFYSWKPLPYWTRIDIAFENRVDPNQMAFSEPSDQDLHCFSFSLWIYMNNQHYLIGWQSEMGVTNLIYSAGLGLINIIPGTEGQTKAFLWSTRLAPIVKLMIFFERVCFTEHLFTRMA